MELFRVGFPHITCTVWGVRELVGYMLRAYPPEVFREDIVIRKRPHNLTLAVF